MIVVYSEERQRFEAVSSYFEKDIPRQERWRWDATVKRWYAGSEDIARRLAQYAQGAARLRLAQMSPEEAAALAASTAADSDLAVPSPPGLDYLPYQRAGIAYALMDRGGAGTLMACEMGLGKTIQAIGVVNMLPDARRVLIIVPASLRLNWAAEWRRWHTGQMRPHLLDVWPGGGLFDETAGKALIVSYDSVQKWHPQIAQTEFDLLIMDEAHLVKDEGSRRAKSIFGGRYTHKNGEGRVKGRTTFEPIQAKRKLMLSGTPIVNKPAELWPLVKALAPDGLGSSRVDFLERYTGPDRLAELHLRLRSQIMVRRKKEDVLKDLPARRRAIVLLDVPDAENILAAEAGAIIMAQVLIDRTRTEIEGLSHAEQVMRLRQCRGIAMTEIARVRKETAIKKLPQAIEHIHEILGNVPKVVLFAHHHEVMDALYAEFSRIGVGFDGRTPLPERHAAVERFQSDPRARVFIGSKAAGLGVTLTAAFVAIMLELQWSPADMDQEESRIHRIGQVNPVLVQHLVIDGSIDAKMAKLLIDKQAIMDAALDGGSSEVASRDILSEVLGA